ncbi:prepilin peptidase [Melghirimyces algeriensis]|uniref:Type IV leader peptidase family protein n=1 Tax=Melghirimyces algeriensis TaxID=910412 RepID=A0A521ARG9_9BACL|nr:A24 family peptidase [Melghirimyces algeriensis]SMO37443.1 Type IV leader peptidase family protein [Melghirimyces algeriensis]
MTGLVFLLGWWLGGRMPVLAGSLFLPMERKRANQYASSWFASWVGGTGFVLVYLVPVSESKQMLGYVLVLYLIACVVLDLSHRLIPNSLNATAVVLILCIRWIMGMEWLDPIISALVGGGALLGISNLFRGGMGGGDIKMTVATGLSLDGYGMTAGLVIAILLGGMYSCFLLLKGKAGRRTPIPFAPHLATGFMIGFLWGEELIKRYISLLV